MKILLTSAGRRSYLVEYFKDALAGNGEVHASNSEWSAAMQVADKAIISPLIYDEAYIDFLLNYCNLNQINAIIPLFDIDLSVLSKSKNIFEQNGIIVIVSDYKVVQCCNDKWETFKFFRKHGIQTANTYLSTHKALEDINEGKLYFPLIIKPRWGMGSLGVHEVCNKKELETIHAKTKSIISNSYLKHESSASKDKTIIIQEKLSGQEYGLDIINDLNGGYIDTFVKRKLSMRAGETDSCITEDNSSLRSFGKRIASILKHVSILDVDCFVQNNKIFALEMNCRFGGGYPFSHIAGANIPLLITHWLSGKPTDFNYMKLKYNIKGLKDIKPIIVDY